VTMRRERHKQEIVRLTVSMRCTGADRLVVVLKYCNGYGAKEPGHYAVDNQSTGIIGGTH